VPIRTALVAALLAAFLIPSAVPARATAPPEDAVPGAVVVGLAPGATIAEVAAVVDAERIAPLSLRPDVLVLDVRVGAEDRTVAEVLRHGVAAWADRDRIVRAAARPSDPLYGHQWHLAVRAIARGGANWEPIAGTGATGKGITVAVIDSGVTPNEDLDGVLPGIDLVDDDDDASDVLGHGTHVAGTIAQSTGNGVGASGVAPDAAILPVRALDATGAGRSSDFIQAVAWAVARGAKVINLSIAAGADGGMCDAVRKATDAGAVVVASAGNDAAPVAYPAACPDAIAVSATAFDGSLAAYSNRGVQIALAAPGGDNGGDLNLDGRPDGILQYTFIEGNGGYSWWAGTSMAAPHVAGAAALLRGIDPSLTPAAVRDLLVTTAFDLGPPGADPSFGAGVLDIARVVSQARDQTALPALPSVPSLPDTVQPGEDDAGSTPSNRTVPNDRTARVAGVDRFATSSAASRAAFSGGAERAYLANGRSFADALAAGAAAGLEPGPVLLTDSCALPAVIADELRRLGPAEVVVVGGEAAICSAVAAQAGVYAGARVSRIAGTDRYATAASLSRSVASRAATVHLASGTVFADSLAGGSAAAIAGGPLLLTAPCELPASARDELARLDPDEIVVVGGSGAVCDAVLDAVADATSARVRRVAGADRFATSALLASEAGDVDALMIASGVTFPDGLSAGGMAATIGSPLLLVPPCALPERVRAEIAERRPERVTIVGGQSAVCEAVVTEADRAAHG
jgi:subtilisin family serine protease